MSTRDRADDVSLSDAFWSVARSLRHQSKDSLSPWDVSMSQLRAVRTLDRHGAMRLGDLATHLGIAPRSATEVVDALEARDLVARTRDPGDRRATLVGLTDRADAMLAELRQTRAAETDAFFGALSDADRRKLLALLRKLMDRPANRE